MNANSRFSLSLRATLDHDNHGRRNFPTEYRAATELAKYPELVFVNRFDFLILGIFAATLCVAGLLLGWFAPALGTNSRQFLILGFFVSTVALLHGMLFINSLAHALITLGEGWHNNRHRYMTAARQGFYWWEIDVTYYLLKALSWTGLIWELNTVPASIYEEGTRRLETDA